MKRQITQFDNERSSASVATPTCSSCCCCCCCLTTTLASSTLLARRINQEAKQKKIKDPIGLTLLAALFLPVIGALTYLLTFAINKDFGHCTQQTYTYSFGSSSYQFCSNPANNLYVIAPIAILVSIFVLSYLYVRVKMGKPVLRAVIVTAIVAAAFVAEGIGGAILILTGVGGIIYLLLIPVLFGAVQRFYSRKILHKTILGNNISNA
jgi:integral membrane sensor domain MASE1